MASSYEFDRAAIMNSKAASFWLKDAVQQLENRDLLDALADAEMLLGMMKKRYAEATAGAPRFPEVWCSQCGKGFGPGNSGFSHCHQHRAA